LLEQEVIIPTDENGYGKNYAIIRMDTQDEVESLISKNIEWKLKGIYPRIRKYSVETTKTA
jgi:hypothetical protein